MPRKIFRQFTGGISNEIDAQNLRDDQGEEAVDINLKGHALEPGDGLTDIEAGHYHYRGEWITDSNAVSFEESGVGVIKTYDDLRPQFEEIINDKENETRDVGPPLPPRTIISGSIVSEGARGLRPADGSHLLSIGSDKLGTVDTGDPESTINPPYSDAPSLREYNANVTSNADDVHFYGGQPYWLEGLKVTTGDYITGGTNNQVTSPTITKYSQGTLFKEGFFVCWDGQYIQTIVLDPSSMTMDTFNTIDPTDGGNDGTTTNQFNQTNTGATGKTISGVDVCNGIVSFSQNVECAGMTVTKYADSDDERWILPNKKDSILFFLRDGGSINHADYHWRSSETGDAGGESSGLYNAAGDDSFEVTHQGREGGVVTETPTWITPSAPSVSTWTWGAHSLGLKYVAVECKKNTWSMVRFIGELKPQIYQVHGRLAFDTQKVRAGWISIYKPGNDLTAYTVKNITVKSEWTLSKVGVRYNKPSDTSSGSASVRHGGYAYYNVEPRIVINIPQWSENITYRQNNVHKTSGAIKSNMYRTIMKQYYHERTNSWQGGGEVGYYYSSSAMGGTPWDWFRMGHNIGEPIKAHDNNVTVTGWEKTESYGFAKGRQYSYKMKLNDTTGSETGYLNRLCSFAVSSSPSLTVQKKFGYSQIWTAATIAKDTETKGSITFAAANDTLFTVDDYIKVQVRSDIEHGRRRYEGWASPPVRSLGWNGYLQRSYTGSLSKGRTNKIIADRGALSTYFTAKILSIDNGDTKINFEIVEPNLVGGKGNYKGVANEKCYPVITSSSPFYEQKNSMFGEATFSSGMDGPNRKVIQTDLEDHVLIGNHKFEFPPVQKIEVRDADGAALETGESDYDHTIDWEEPATYQTSNKTKVTSWKDLDIRAVSTSPSNSHPRIFYRDAAGKNLLSQNGTERGNPRSLPFSNDGIYYLTNSLITIVDGGNINIYNPTYDFQYGKSKPELLKGLGITGDVQDAIHFDNAYGVQVFIKMSDKWKLVRTGTVKTVEGKYSETSLLKYNFFKPLHYDGIDKAWALHGDSSSGYNIHTAIPFFESDLRGSYVYYANAGNTKSAWGQVKKIRLGVADASENIPRHLSIHWAFDSGTYSGASGTLAIGLNHEAGKLLGDDNEFIWYPLNKPSTLLDATTYQAKKITDPKIQIKFTSRVTRDVVFFREEETVLPATGQTGAQNRVQFLNYAVATQNFYVLNDKAIILHGGAKTKERGVLLGQADKITGSTVAFDASRVGQSAFLVGAPNMFNKNGPNIDFYYRASFVDKWSHESAPSPLPTEGIAPLDSADDCIQLNLDKDFFHFDNTDIEKIRLYRYGGDSSEFMFLRDIPMPDITSLPVKLEGLIADFTRKTATSQFYELRTYDDITLLSNFVNTNFTLTATAVGGASASQLDGSWNINSLEESTSPNASGTTDYSSTIDAAGIDEIDTDILVASTTSPAWPASGVVKIGEEYILYDSIVALTLKDCTRGYYVDETNAVSHDGGVAVHVVEWLMEIEHRNQDTAILVTAIDTPLGSTATNIYVDDASLFVPGGGQILIGNEIFDYTSTNTGNTAEEERHIIVGVTHNNAGSLPTTHEEGVIVFSYEEDYSAVTSVTGMDITIDSFGYRDKARTPIASLFYMQEDNYPPLGLVYNEDKKGFYETESEDDFFRYIKAVGSMYFAGLDANLKFSRYGTPEYWPLDAVITLDSEIRAIKEHAGEGLVWTTNSLYRVRGTDPKAMVAFRVPDAHGIKGGDEHTVEVFNGGVVWLTANDGIAFYNAGKVTYLTRDKHLVTDLIKPSSCVTGGVYWLFQRPGSGNGFRLEITGGELRLCHTSIEGYYAHYAKTLGKAVIVTGDNVLGATGETFSVSEVGGKKADNIEWRSKKIDAGEPAIAKALGSLAVVYEALDSKSANTHTNGIRGQGLIIGLLGLDASDLDAGDNLQEATGDTATDLYDIFTKYNQLDQTFEIDLDGGLINSNSFTEAERKKIIMPVDFLETSVPPLVGDVIWNEMLEDNTTVESIGTEYVGEITYAVVASNSSSDLLFTDADHTLQDGDEIQFTATTTLPGNITVDTNYYVNGKTGTTFKVETVVDGGNVQYSSTAGSGVSYGKTNPTIVLDKEPLRSGSGVIYWGNLPVVDVFINNDTAPARSFVLPPTDSIEPLSIDLYLTDLRRFRTLSIEIRGNVRVQTVSLRHYPLQNYQTQTLHHSADVFYKGEIDLRVMLDGTLIYRRELENAGEEFTEERVYLPASSYGQRVHYMNESRSGMIESVTFNGSLVA